MEPFFGFDGLCVVGEVRDVAPASYSDGRVIEGLMRVVVSTSRGDVRIDIRESVTTVMGRADLPAFDVLRLARGKRCAISVAPTTSRDSSYINYLAIEAVELSAPAVAKVA